MNKYKSQSRKARKAAMKMRGCDGKAAFPSKDAAFQKGQRSYKCQFCGQWHRSGSFLTVVKKSGRKR